MSGDLLLVVPFFTVLLMLITMNPFAREYYMGGDGNRTRIAFRFCLGDTVSVGTVRNCIKLREKFVAPATGLKQLQEGVTLMT
jgi:hypothetical protein